MNDVEFCSDIDDIIQLLKEAKFYYVEECFKLCEYRIQLAIKNSQSIKDNIFKEELSNF